jgi:hypothetical protein
MAAIAAVSVTEGDPDAEAIEHRARRAKALELEALLRRECVLPPPTSAGITPQVRVIGLDWVLEVCDDFALGIDAFQRAVSISDAVLARRKVATEEYQCVLSASTRVASMLLESYPPTTKDFAVATDGACTRNQIRQMVMEIVTSMAHHLNLAIPTDFVGDLFRESYGPQLAHLLNAFVIERRDVLPSRIAAACVFVVAPTEPDRVCGYRRCDLVPELKIATRLHAAVVLAHPVIPYKVHTEYHVKLRLAETDMCSRAVHHPRIKGNVVAERIKDRDRPKADVEWRYIFGLLPPEKPERELSSDASMMATSASESSTPHRMDMDLTTTEHICATEDLGKRSADSGAESGAAWKRSRCTCDGNTL